MEFLELFLTFFKIGAFTFGGGYAMLPFIQSEVAAHTAWGISGEELINFIAVSESTPGPFAINMATYIGSTVGGSYGLWGNLLGALCATLGVVLPSFIVIIIVARLYDKFRKSTVIQGCMAGLKPAVVGLIGAALLSIATTVLFPAGLSLDAVLNLKFALSLLLFGGMAVLAIKKVHPIVIIGISAALGIGMGYLCA